MLAQVMAVNMCQKGHLFTPNRRFLLFLANIWSVGMFQVGPCCCLQYGRLTNDVGSRPSRCQLA